MKTIAPIPRCGYYAINFDDVQGQALLDQAAELDIQFPLLANDPGPALGLARPTVLPTTLVVSPTGELAARPLGPQTTASIEKALAEAAAARREG